MTISAQKKGTVLNSGVSTVTVTLSPLLADIVEQLVARQIAINVVARFNTRNWLNEKLLQIGPDLVLLGLRVLETDEIGRSLLKLLPMAKIIAFSSDARQVFLYEMRAHCTTIKDVSARALIAAIRGPGPNSENG